MHAWGGDKGNMACMPVAESLAAGRWPVSRPCMRDAIGRGDEQGRLPPKGETPRQELTEAETAVRSVGAGSKWRPSKTGSQERTSYRS